MRAVTSTAARVVTVLALVAVTVVVAPSSGAAATPEPTVAVAMGDSYVAGQAGRWNGNSSYDYGDRSGTDRAAQRRGWFWRYVQEDVYGASYANGCNRSDVAPIISAGLDVAAVFNLACSGAETRHVLPASAGGEPYRGEDPQLDQLAYVARTHDVEVVVLSIGGNDLGFADIIVDCAAGYLTSSRWNPNTCRADQDRNVKRALPGTLDAVQRILQETTRVLEANGDGDARIILQSYPSPVVESGNARYSQTSWKRVFRGLCPFWDVDLDWANQTLVPTINDGFAAEAKEAGVEFLDLSQSLKGHEPCASTARRGTGGDGVDAQWVRFVSTGIGQGDAGESAHPNAYGQRALGRCLALALATDDRPDTCRNSPGGGVSDMFLD